MSGQRASSGSGGQAPALDTAIDFQIALPPGWWELPLLAPDLREAITETVDRRLALSPPAGPDRDALIDSLFVAGTQAQSIGAVFAAQIAARTAQLDFALAMMVVLTELRLPHLGHEPEDLELLVSMLREQSGGTPSTIEAVTLGRLGSGLREHGQAEAEERPITTITYWFPVRGTSRVVIIRVTAPDLIDAGGVIPLLDEIVSTAVVTPLRPRTGPAA